MSSLSIEVALKAFAEGKFVIITDDETRENEGDLMLLAEKATTESLGFMVRYTSGVICVAMTEEIARNLQLPIMVKRNQDEKRTAFTVSVDVLQGNTTGISAEERANTVRHLSDPAAQPADFMRPGHVFPLIAKEGLFNSRQGHTEAGVVMAQLIGARPLTALSEIVMDDGSMARGDALKSFAALHKIPIFTMQELITYAEGKLPTATRKQLSYSWAKLQEVRSTGRLRSIPPLPEVRARFCAWEPLVAGPWCDSTLNASLVTRLEVAAVIVVTSLKNLSLLLKLPDRGT